MKKEHKWCPNQRTPYLLSDNVDQGKRSIIKARCKMWSCEYCGEVNAYQHKIRMLNGINELQNKGQQFSFVTLTSHRKLHTTADCLRAWRSAWRRLRERIRRIHKKNSDDELAFCIVTEFHKDERLHWHMLINCQLSTRWYKDNSSECGLGYQCKSVKLDNAIQGANYTTKYLSKSLDQKTYPKKMRRIVYSQTFPDKPDFVTGNIWQILDAKTSLVEAIEQGWRLDLDTYLNGEEIVEIITE